MKTQNHMLKTLTLISILTLLVQTSQAASRFQFFPGNQNAMLVVTPQAADGVSDSDSVELFKFMNVPIQDGMLGKGKSIVSPGREFNMVCGEYKQQCQFVLNRSALVAMDPSNRRMQFKLTGEAADQLTMLFQMTGDRQMDFMATDRQFQLHGEPGLFLFQASQGGL